ncbi:hypothetical protein RQP46_000381 [Phenoliferia psychrophenolica]
MRSPGDESSSPGAADVLLELAHVAINLGESVQHHSAPRGGSTTRGGRASSHTSANFFALADERSPRGLAGNGSGSGLGFGLGGVAVGLGGVGIDSTLTPAQSPFGFEVTTPTTGTINLPEVTDYDYFASESADAWAGDALAGPSASARSGSIDDGEVASSDLRTKLQELEQMDHEADDAFAANTQYEEDILVVLNRLAAATARTENLLTLVGDLATSLATGSELSVSAPGTQTVSLPWFKHYHGKDLPPNPDGQARDLYLATIRHFPWTLLERTALKTEIIDHNQREIAAQAQRNGQDVYEVLAGYSQEHFAEMTELLDWDKIALVIPRRSPMECKIQWLQHDHPKINLGPWSKDESQALYQVAEARDGRDWAAIALELGTHRTASECLRQYRRRTGQEKTLWKPADDAKLKEAVALFGENWQSVARFVGRHSNQCINRWSKTLRPTIKKGKWSTEEDEMLQAAVASCGRAWKQVALRVTGKTDAQCRERWVNVLDPKLLDPSKWSEEEEATLIRLREVEKKSWSEIANAFSGRRTDNHCMRCYNNILKRREHPEGIKRGPKVDPNGKPSGRKRPAPTMIESPSPSPSPTRAPPQPNTSTSMSEAPVTQAIVADAQEVGFKVFVGNLSFATKDEQLTEIFGSMGKITNAQIINRGTRSLGYGFVTFTEEADAIKAISTLDKSEIAGRQINVELAKPPTATPAGRAPREAAQAAINSTATTTEEGAEGAPKARKPRAKRPKGPRKPRADGETEEAGDAPADVKDVTAQLAATTLDAEGNPVVRGGRGGRRGGRTGTDSAAITPRAPRPPHGPPTGEPSKTLIFVSNLAFSVTDETLAAFFGAFKLKSARVVTKKFGPGEGRSKGFGFIEVENEADQAAALQLSGSELDGRQITLKVAINPEEKAAETVEA